MNELKGPIHRQISEYIKSKTVLEFRTVTNEVLIGNIIWTDKNWLHLLLENGKELTLSIKSIAYYLKH